MLFNPDVFPDTCSKNTNKLQIPHVQDTPPGADSSSDRSLRRQYGRLIDPDALFLDNLLIAADIMACNILSTYECGSPPREEKFSTAEEDFAHLPHLALPMMGN